jgi:hypothetical protein
MKVRNLILLALMFNAHVAYGENLESELSSNSALVSFDEIIDSIEDPVPERTTTGTIEAIDLSARTAVIGGYIYHFGPATDSTPLQVKLLGRDFGSLEMLSAGMDLQIYFFQSPAGDRIGTELIQIEAADVD